MAEQHIQKRVPLRKCIGCGEMIGKKGLLRIVRSKEGEVTLDPIGKKPGRGAYLCQDAKCFECARKNKGLERALKCKIPDQVYDALTKEIEQL